jgi:hypothetical protein
MGKADDAFGKQAEEGGEEAHSGRAESLSLDIEPRITDVSQLVSSIREGASFDTPEEWVDQLLGLPKDVRHEEYYTPAGHNEKISGTFDGRGVSLVEGITGIPRGTIDGVEVDRQTAQLYMERLRPLARYHGAFKHFIDGITGKLESQIGSLEHKLDEAHQAEKEREGRLLGEKERRGKEIEQLLKNRLREMEGLSDEDVGFLEEVIAGIVELETIEFNSVENLISSVTQAKTGDGRLDYQRRDPRSARVVTLRSSNKAERYGAKTDEERRQLRESEDTRNRRRKLLGELLSIDEKKAQPWGDVVYGWTDFKVYDTILHDVVLIDNFGRRDDDFSRDEVVIERNSRYKRVEPSESE